MNGIEKRKRHEMNMVDMLTLYQRGAAKDVDILKVYSRVVTGTGKFEFKYQRKSKQNITYDHLIYFSDSHEYIYLLHFPI